QGSVDCFRRRNTCPLIAFAVLLWSLDAVWSVGSAAASTEECVPDAEIVADGIDQDCDGVDTCYQDLDGDSWGSEIEIDDANLDCDDDVFRPSLPGLPPSGRTSSRTGDCLDTPGVGEGFSGVDINPGAVDVPGNAVDENCDGHLAGCFAEIAGDGIDQDCDGVELCFVDRDGDGWGTESTVLDSNMDCDDDSVDPFRGVPDFTSSRTGDCNDTVSGGVTIYPRPDEDTIGDNVDDNCDGFVACYADLDGDRFGSDDVVQNASMSCDAAGVAGTAGDVCPDVYDPGQADLDNDGVGDACDPCTDPDGDGYADAAFAASTCPLDNCPGLANADSQELDEDQDGVGDVCDPCPGDAINDPDGNGVCGCQRGVSCYELCAGAAGCGVVGDDGCGGTLWCLGECGPVGGSSFSPVLAANDPTVDVTVSMFAQNAALTLNGFYAGSFDVGFSVQEDAYLHIDSYTGEGYLSATLKVEDLGGGPGTLGELWTLALPVSQVEPAAELPTSISIQDSSVVDTWLAFSIGEGTLTRRASPLDERSVSGPPDSLLQVGASANNQSLGCGALAQLIIERADGVVGDASLRLNLTPAVN
ncbi:MAG: hypothetical protein AAGJ56_10065, partial [Myxococcota bacterium]